MQWKENLQHPKPLSLRACLLWVDIDLIVSNNNNFDLRISVAFNHQNMSYWLYIYIYIYIYVCTLNISIMGHKEGYYWEPLYTHFWKFVITLGYTGQWSSRVTSEYTVIAETILQIFVKMIWNDNICQKYEYLIHKWWVNWQNGLSFLYSIMNLYTTRWNPVDFTVVTITQLTI